MNSTAPRQGFMTNGYERGNDEMKLFAVSAVTGEHNNKLYICMLACHVQYAWKVFITPIICKTLLYMWEIVAA